MKKGDITTENINNLIFPIYCEFGGKNFPKIVKEINKRHGMMASIPTLYRWEKEYNFKERMKNMDIAKRKAEDDYRTIEERVLRSLFKQKEKYEKYFDTLSLPDHQATYAYTGIMKAIIDVKKKLAVSDVVKKAEENKAMTKEELLKMIKEEVYGLEERSSTLHKEDKSDAGD